MRVKTIIAASVVALCCFTLVTVHRSKKGYLNAVVHAQAVIDPCSDTSVLKSSVALTNFSKDLVASVPGTAIYICGFAMIGSGGGSERLGYGDLHAVPVGDIYSVDR
ncbi:MAG TPA: hypothetical protein VOA41_17805 [Candidatus Dormibacteraeota bacterium]|nr:hypothetical protein [Candidatus Dormibacteraeota bacterium]